MAKKAVAIIFVVICCFFIGCHGSRRGKCLDLMSERMPMLKIEAWIFYNSFDLSRRQAEEFIDMKLDQCIERENPRPKPEQATQI